MKRQEQANLQTGCSLVVSPHGSAVKKPPANARCGFDPWLRTIPGEGNINRLQYSCLENPMDRGAWKATVHGIAKSRT